ncbi:hypothetical protein H7X68_00595 [Candidatus Saccharibacteria bacterium]|nr:hypothetical protein [Candidatus Saccharibacteria bacterium]
MKYTTVAVIYNPNSTGPSETLAKIFETNLRLKLPKQKIELIATEHAGHGEELAYLIAKSSKNPLIISSSGDGGYHEVINGVMKAQNEGFQSITGLLPAGNANDHYNNLHNEDIIDLIIKNKTKKIDLLKIVSTSKGKSIERYAHSYIGFGLTPSVGKELNKTRLNILTEAWVVVRTLFSIKPVRLKVGKKTRYYESIIFSNVDRMSKYLKISQPSRITDGVFEVTIFKPRNKIKLVMLLLRASLNGLKEDDQVSEFVLETTDKVLVQTDGEVMTLDAYSQVLIKIEKLMLTCII